MRLKYQWVDPTGSDGPREYKREKQSTYGTSSETFFDADGHMTAVSFSHNRNDGTYSGTNFINYETDMSGQVTYRYEGGSGSGGSSGSGESGSINERYYRFAGQAMGEIGNNGTANVDYATTIARREESGTGYFRGGDTTGTPNADFDVNHVTLASSAGAGSGSGYVAQGGESLQQVARQLWGDSSLWYRLAEANGLSAGTILAAGQNIAVPAGVVSNTHNASSLQPYDPAKAIGDLTPGTLTPNPPAGKKGCGTFGIVLLAVVAIAVTAITYGALTAQATTIASTATATVGGTTVATATTATLTVAGTGGVLAGGGLATVAAGAISAAAGSIVSQGLGVITRIQEKFSWKNVGLAALSGAVGGALGANGPFKNGAFSGLNTSDAIRAGLRAATNTAVSQGIGRLTGLQDSFSWAGVAASAVGAVAGTKFGDRVDAKSLARSNTIGNHAANLGVSTVSLLTNAATRSAIEGTSFKRNVSAAIPDVIAQAIYDIADAGVSVPGKQVKADPVQTGGGGGALGPADRVKRDKYGLPKSSLIPDVTMHWGDGGSWLEGPLQRIMGAFGVGDGESWLGDLYDRAYEIVVNAPRILENVFRSITWEADTRAEQTSVKATQTVTNARANAELVNARAAQQQLSVIKGVSGSVANATVGPNTLLGKHVIGPINDAFFATMGAIANSPAGDPGVIMAVEQAHPVGAMGGVVLSATRQLAALGGTLRVANAASRAKPLAIADDPLAVVSGRVSAPVAAKGPLVSEVRAISANDVNAPFLAKGWDAPYSYGSQARTFTTGVDLDFVRVTTTNPQGAFLVRAKEIAGMSPAEIQVHLALPKVPTNMLDVRVPAGTQMQTGFVGPQPSFGVANRGGVQYQILDQIPSKSFGPMRPIR